MPHLVSKIGRIFKPLIPTLVLLLAAETVLRATKIAPSGNFDFLLPATFGLYPPNETIKNEWGPIPYLVETNELGLRGTGVKSTRRGSRRIVTIGDSITDGFFVDNDGTFQHFLQRLLDENSAASYEVINAARGGGSIEKEYAILKGIVLRLKPEIVILTFVTNDISDLQGKSRQQLVDHELLFQEHNVSPARRAAMLFFTRTAVGEMMFRLYWKIFIPARETPAEVDGTDRDDARYLIQGGADFARNVDNFRLRFSSTDGLVLTEEFSPAARVLIDNYVYLLERFADTCHDNKIVPVFVYYPSYTQVYDPTTPTTIQDVLRDSCGRLSMPFLDLTEPLRRSGKDKVLHLAPVDYHPNPEGNSVIANAIYEFLLAQGLVDSR